MGKNGQKNVFKKKNKNKKSTTNSKNNSKSTPSAVDVDEFPPSPTPDDEEDDLFKDFLTPEIYRLLEKTDIINGFPMKSVPFRHPCQAYVDSFKVLKTTDGKRVLGLQMAQKGCPLKVHPGCMKLIQQNLLEWFQSAPEMRAAIETLPNRNILSITYAADTFQLGRSLHKFYHEKNSAPSFLTYQRLSDRAEACYFNQRGKSYLAGITYYPETTEEAYFMYNDNAVMYLCTLASEGYSPRDKDMFTFNTLGKYGRYCPRMRKRMVVQAGGLHLEFDHEELKYVMKKCGWCYADWLERLHRMHGSQLPARTYSELDISTVVKLRKQQDETEEGSKKIMRPEEGKEHEKEGKKRSKSVPSRTIVPDDQPVMRTVHTRGLATA